MDIDIKNISITNYLIAHGYKPSSSAHGCTWFSSPLKNGDKTPSFKIDEGKNVWYDHSLGFGGNIFTLIKEMDRITDREVFEKLEDLDPSHQCSTSEIATQPGLKIDRTVPLSSPALLHYLKQRSINIKVAQEYLSQIYYTVRERQYFAIGFCNDKGGWELRNKKYKLSSSPKYFRTIPGKQPGLNVFEGFMDYLSALTYFGSPVLNNTTIVLNSVSFINDLIPLLHSYPMVNLFLDNDTAGEKAANDISQEHSNTRNLATELYPEYKDFNEMLMDTNVTANS